jgi:hypothetical protein
MISGGNLHKLSRPTGTTGIRFPAGTDISLRHRVQISSGFHPVSYSLDTERPFPAGKSSWGMKLTIQLHLVPRFRMHGAIPPLPHTFPSCVAKLGKGFFTFATSCKFNV